MYLPNGEFGDRPDGNALIPDNRAKKAPNATMNGTTCDGRVPVLSSRARLSLKISFALKAKIAYHTPADGTAN
jgi:hypothetical protein